MEAEYLLKGFDGFSDYAGRCIAVVKGKLISDGATRIEAYKKAKKMYPKEKVAIFYIPTEEEMVPLL